MTPTEVENQALPNRCSSCKHWGDNRIGDNVQFWLENSHRYKECLLGDLNESKGFMYPVCESEGIGGELLTRDDFGCILYESR